ncbi:FAD-binding oxidoreductase [Niallia sp. NCCP-28]|uniref:NAD(P)/FAD-dependent oxidoreductase n=1 Tax=Niallia sp. NCCP-28 TaxID=2934712 RepID=UPI0020887C38|nr:FAD-binding oxidoreductase [Niallia sp. NCCP-28]GKU82241.1 oxidoreductase [Niallia sp. NCCP-28]
MKKVIVVGGGILGAATAFELAKRKASVTIIDSEHSGRATAAAAGIICPWISQRRNKRWYSLARNGAKYYPALIDELAFYQESTTGYAKVGAISLHSDSAKLEAMFERTLKRKVEAPEIGDVSILRPEQAKALFPLLADGYGAVHVSGAARVDGQALRNSLISASKKLGAHYLKGTCTLLTDKQKTIGVQTENGSILADEVIVAGGAWANHVLQPLNISFQVTEQKGQIVHLELPNIDCHKWPVVMPPHDQYILALENNRIVIGATHENNTNFDYRITVGGIKEIIDKALLFAPGLIDSTFLETKVGFRPFTPDFLPVFGRIKGKDGLLIANGLGASGLTMGPFIGQQLAKYLLETPDIDFSDYSVDDCILENNKAFK